jgi:hypothetical protein
MKVIKVQKLYLVHNILLQIVELMMEEIIII